MYMSDPNTHISRIYDPTCYSVPLQSNFSDQNDRSTYVR